MRLYVHEEVRASSFFVKKTHTHFIHFRLFNLDDWALELDTDPNLKHINSGIIKKTDYNLIRNRTLPIKDSNYSLHVYFNAI
jgi:hypothetical protein